MSSDKAAAKGAADALPTASFISIAQTCPVCPASLASLAF